MAPKMKYYTNIDIVRSTSLELASRWLQISSSQEALLRIKSSVLSKITLADRTTMITTTGATETALLKTTLSKIYTMVSAV